MVKWVIAMIMMSMSASVAAKSIVVVGDSISAGYGIELQQSWVVLLQTKLVGHQVHNASTSGDTSAEGLARIDAVLTRYQPDWVLLELGANDGLRGISPAVMKANLTEIIRRVQQTGAQVFLLGMKIPPNYGTRYTAWFDSTYPQLAEEFKLPLIPFLLEKVALDKDLMQADGLHPNAKAQAMIADFVAA